MTITDWLKKAWCWLIGLAVFVAAVVLWRLSHKRSGWAAQKILEHQHHSEKRIALLTQKTNQRVKQLDTKRQKEREKLENRERQLIARIKKEHKLLSAAVLKQKMLGDLDEPL